MHQIEMHADKSARKWLQRGLVLAVVWCLFLIAFGAFVRLSDAGLGCPDWPTCYGRLTWPGHEEVNVAKAWPEQVHRHIAAGLGLQVFGLTLLARRMQRDSLVSTVVGCAFIALAMTLYITAKSLSLVSGPGSFAAMVLGELILIYSAWSSRGLARWLTFTLALICFQALLGMWTVTLLVKPAVVTAHLLGGLATLSLFLYCALLAHLKKSTQQYRARPSIAPIWVKLGIVLLVTQITLGGWVSTNYAALACPDFPKCKGQWLPETDFKEGFVVWREIGVNYEGGVLDAPARTAVHLTHRVGAIIVSGYLLLLAFLALRPKTSTFFPSGNVRAPALLMIVCLLTQISLGISNIVFALPLWVAVGHNAMAAMLLVSMIWLWWRNSAADVAKA
jgi:cytochrome c oxidase assembly protein subunit 15